MDKRYYFANGTQQIGPMSFTDLRNQRVSPDTLFWYEGLPGWKKGRELPELSSLFISAPPVPPQAPPAYTPPPYYNQPPYGYPYGQLQLKPTPPFYEWWKIVWKKAFQLQGRARRSEYWYFNLLNNLIYLLPTFLSGSIAKLFGVKAILFVGFLQIAYLLISSIPGLTAAVRRMHDVGKSGWFLLIPVYNIVLLCSEGTIGPNQYGPDPKHII